MTVFPPLFRFRAHRARCSLLCLVLSLAGCAAPPTQEPSEGHLGLERPSDAAEKAQIPEPVVQAPALPPPSDEEAEQTYTVIVNEVPVKELLFALARDARLNLDIYDDIEGLITINAIDQTLPQILQRISRQSNIRYRIEGDTLTVSADTPYLKTYKVGYVNQSRESIGQIELSTQIGASGVAGGASGRMNNSTLSVRNTSTSNFWRTLFLNISSMVGDRRARQAAPDDLTGENVVVNREAGLVSVRATSTQHDDIQAFLDQVTASTQRQVLIEATVVEVGLNRAYQAGVDWSRITTELVNGEEFPDGVNVEQQLLGNNLVNAPTTVLTYGDIDDDTVISASVRLLEQFGDVQVLSSPKVMALNNQTSVLKVVDNRVYFTIEVDTSQNETTTLQTFETEVHTVPVGLVMSLIPYISENDEVMLNIRPTISRILQFVNDPNPLLVEAGVTSRIPEIQVREMESVLRLNDGQVAVIGGLMQDSVNKNTDGVPGLSRVPGVGEAFKYRNDRVEKTELVIFLRTTVIREPSLEGDLNHFRRFLPGRRTGRSSTDS